MAGARRSAGWVAGIFRVVFHRLIPAQEGEAVRPPQRTINSRHVLFNPRGQRPFR